MYQELIDRLSTPISELDLLPPLIVSADDSYDTVSQKIRETGHGIATVYDGDEYVGTLLERNLLLSLFDRPMAREMASQFPFQLHHDTTVIDALRLAIVKNSYYLPVFNESGVVDNYLSIRLILNLIMGYFEDVREKYGTLFKWELETNYPYLCTTISLDESTAHEITPEALELPLLRVSSTPVSIIDTEASTREILEEMIKSTTGIVALTKFGTIIDGIITERDYLNKMSSFTPDELFEQDIHNFMTSSPDVLMPQYRVIYAINNIMHRGYRSVLLVNEDKIPVSTVSMVDILRFIAENLFPSGGV